MRVPSPATVFAVLGATLGTALFFASPPMWWGDENTHFRQAVRLAEGDPRPACASAGESSLPQSIVRLIYFVSVLLTRGLSRYRELCADRSGAYLTGKPSALASALTKISGEIARIPTRDLRETQAANAFMFAPAFTRDSLSSLFSTHPPLEQRLEQLAKISADLSKPTT